MERIVIFPLNIFYSDLTPVEFKVLVALYSFNNRKTNACFPSLRKIADLTGHKDITEISKITKRLELKGLLKKKRRGYNRSMSYQLLAPQGNNCVGGKSQVRVGENYQDGVGSKCQAGLGGISQDELTIELTKEQKKESGSRIRPFDYF